MALGNEDRGMDRQTRHRFESKFITEPSEKKWA
jgi:hypothetical protein